MPWGGSRQSFSRWKSFFTTHGKTRSIGTIRYLTTVENWAFQFSNHAYPLLLFTGWSYSRIDATAWFSYASKKAYAGVVYLRMVDSIGSAHTLLVFSKWRYLRYNSCLYPDGNCVVLMCLPNYFIMPRRYFKLQWIISTPWRTALSCWVGCLATFKTYVENRISYIIIDQVSPHRWSHVAGTDDPADCTSQGLFPAQQKEHKLWWKGPHWLLLEPSTWPEQTSLPTKAVSEERELWHFTNHDSTQTTDHRFWSLCKFHSSQGSHCLDSPFHQQCSPFDS